MHDIIESLEHQFGLKVSIEVDPVSSHHHLVKFLELLCILYADLFSAGRFQHLIECKFEGNGLTASHKDAVRIHLPVPLDTATRSVRADEFLHITEFAFEAYPLASIYFERPSFPQNVSIHNSRYSEIDIYLRSTGSYLMPLPPAEFDLLNLIYSKYRNPL